MRRGHHIVVAMTALAVAQPAYACMDVNGSAILLNKPPAAMPRGFIVLRLKSPVAQPTTNTRGIQRVPATVAAGDPRLIGRRIFIEVPPSDSCNYWNQSDSAAYVVGRLYRSAGQLRLQPKTYPVRMR